MILRKPKNTKSGMGNAQTNAMQAASETFAYKKRSLLSQFKRDRRGAVAIEFGILVVPFMALIFAIFESCLSFTAQQVMSNATDTVARQVRTGELKNLNETSVKALICDRLEILVETDCPELEVDLKQYANFQSVPKTIPFTGNGDVNTSGFGVNPGGASTINQLRVFYRWPVITDFMRAQASSLPDSKTLLYSSTTWRNESFD